MRTIGVGGSDIGRIRGSNEDHWLADDALGLYLVCDGMGEHAAGEVAATTAAEAVEMYIRPRVADLAAAHADGGDVEPVRGLVEAAIQLASEAVYELATADDERAGMGCTLTMMLVAGTQVVVGHVGDTRAYMVRDGVVHRLTQDHTVAQELFRGGLISQDEAEDHPYTNVLTRSIGTQSAVQVDLLVMDVLAGDRFLLCSDGLTRYVDDDLWLGQSIAGAELAVIPGRLIEFANDAGGQDNITAVVVESVAERPDRSMVDEQRQAVLRRQVALEKVFLFEYLPLARICRVLDVCTDDLYVDGELLVKQGEPNAALWIVLDGELGVVRDGEEVGRLKPGMYAGVDTLLRKRPARAALVSRGSSRVMRLDSLRFRELARARPWLGVSLLERLGRRLGRDNERLRARLASGAEPGEPPVIGEQF